MEGSTKTTLVGGRNLLACKIVKEKFKSENPYFIDVVPRENLLSQNPP